MIGGTAVTPYITDNDSGCLVPVPTYLPLTASGGS